MESLVFKLPTPKQNQTFAEPDLWKRPGKTAENKTEICLPHSSLSAMTGIPTEEQSGDPLPLDTQTQLFLVFFVRNQQPHKKHLLRTHAPGQSGEGQGSCHFSTGGQFTCKQ